MTRREINMSDLQLKDYLRSARERAYFTQAEVSEALGYETSQFISNWERGLSCPPLRALNMIAKLYKVNIDELFELIVSFTLKQTENAMTTEYHKLQQHEIIDKSRTSVV
jgi:transcriptional regulator with XRE-family HTH domain